MGRKKLPTDELNLTSREHKILDYLKEAVLQRGYPPTVRELCDAMDVKSTSTIHKDLQSLEDKGFIRKDPAKPRALEIMGFDRLSALQRYAVSSQQSSDTSIDAHGAHEDVNSYDASTDDPAGKYADIDDIYDRPSVLQIPLVGQVAAGTPILAKENITDFFPIPERYINSGADHFMLTVKGESMIEAGIFDGDLILVRSQNTAKNGDMAVAMIDGFESEATVKTFYREGDHIRLQPENSSMSPIIVRDVKILGIVKGVFRYFN